MAFAQPRPASQRYATFGAVLGFHLILALVVVKEFTPGLIQRITPPPFMPTFDVKPPPPAPPPDAKPKPRPTSQFTAPTPPIPLDHTVTEFKVALPTFEPPKLADPIPTFNPPPPTPQKPAFMPKSPSPINSPSSWATNNDYPASALRREERGTSVFRVTVGTDGRVKACEILKSSGSPRLDDATCRLVTNRARFEAANDTSGEKVVGTYTNSVRWFLHD